MLATYARYRFERRILIVGMLWLLAGSMVYMLDRQPGSIWFLPAELQLHLAALPLQQFSDAFPTFASSIALSLVFVWILGCGKQGAAAICVTILLGQVGYQCALRADFASWATPLLPDFFRYWPLNEVERFLGRGGFNMNNVFSAVLGGIIAYMVVVNSRPNRHRI